MDPSIFLFSLCGIQLKYRCGFYPHCTITKVSYVVMHFHVNKLVNVSMLTINVDNCIHLVFKITASYYVYLLIMSQCIYDRCILENNFSDCNDRFLLFSFTYFYYISTFRQIICKWFKEGIFVFIALRPSLILDEWDDCFIVIVGRIIVLKF